MSCSRNKPRFLTTSNYNYNITKSNIFAATVGKLGSGESQVINNNRVNLVSRELLEVWLREIPESIVATQLAWCISAEISTLEVFH